jgi:hypothetical protein
MIGPGCVDVYHVPRASCGSRLGMPAAQSTRVDLWMHAGDRLEHLHLVEA